MHIVRTSFAFPARFYHRLRAVSKQRNLPLSQTVKILLEPALETEEECTRKSVYAAFDRVKGMSKSPITDASQTINDVLYGDPKNEIKI